jgi:hypothetical protein
MAATIVSVSFGMLPSASSTSSGNITTPISAAGNALVVFIYGSWAITSATFESVAMAVKADEGSDYNHRAWLFRYNCSQNDDTLVVNYSGYGAWYYIAFEISGVSAASDPWDTAALYENSYNDTTPGCGSITTGTTGIGLCIAAFRDASSVASSCSQGSGWTAGSFNSSYYLYYEYLSSVASTGYGSTGTEMTSVGGNCSWKAGICNIFGLSAIDQEGFRWRNDDGSE